MGRRGSIASGTTAKNESTEPSLQALLDSLTHTRNLSISLYWRAIQARELLVVFFDWNHRNKLAKPA